MLHVLCIFNPVFFVSRSGSNGESLRNRVQEPLRLLSGPEAIFAVGT